MSTVAKWYIGVILGSGAGILLLAARSWSSASLLQFAAFLGFVAFASTLKIRIPGMTATMSPNFAFLLLGMAVFTFSEVVTACLVAALVQSFWRPRRLRFIHVLFSAAALVLSGALAFTASHFIVRAMAGNSTLALILFAGTLYLPANTSLVSAVVSLAERHSLKELWQQCYVSVFPYFVFGIVLAGLISGTLSTASTWQSSLLLSPAMLLAYLYFIGRKRHLIHNQSTVMHTEEEELMAASYHR